MFQPHSDVIYVRSDGTSVPSVVVGPSPHGERYLTVRYSRHGSDIVNDRAPINKITAVEPQLSSPSYSPPVCSTTTIICIGSVSEWCWCKNIPSSLLLLPSLLSSPVSLPLPLISVSYSIVGQIEFVFAQANRGVWGMAHVFNKKLYLTRDVINGDFIPSNLNMQDGAKKVKVHWGSKKGFSTSAME
jgi:hypothetical protein